MFNYLKKLKNLCSPTASRWRPGRRACGRCWARTQWAGTAASAWCSRPCDTWPSASSNASASALRYVRIVREITRAILSLSSIILTVHCVLVIGTISWLRPQCGQRSGSISATYNWVAGELTESGGRWSLHFQVRVQVGAVRLASTRALTRTQGSYVGWSIWCLGNSMWHCSLSCHNSHYFSTSRWAN